MPRTTAVPLTKRMVDATPLPPTGEVMLRDRTVPGFALRVYASGRRVWMYQYRAPKGGASRRLTLGLFPALTVDDARTLAKKAALELAAGRDPQAGDDDAARMADVMTLYLAERSGKLAERSAVEYQRVWTTLLEPTFGAVLVSQLAEAPIARWHADKQATPFAANRAVDLLSAFCGWAERRGYRARRSNPCTYVERYPEPRRGRSLSVAEYGQLGAALARALTDGLRPAPNKQKRVSNPDTTKHRPNNADRPKRQNPTIIAALKFLALSGWREQEALTLRWDALNVARGVAVLTDTKSGRSERPLGKAALAVLQTQTVVVGNPYVFVGLKPGSHLTDAGYTWQSVRHAAALEVAAPFRLHDLRHSFTTVARDELEIQDACTARMVGHTLSGQTSKYGEVRDATVSAAADRIAATIAGYLNGTKTTVLPFRKQARR